MSYTSNKVIDISKYPKYSILFSCLDDMHIWIQKYGLDYALNCLLVKGHIGNNDGYPWELARWSEHYMAEDKEENEFDDKMIPNVAPDDYLAWADPWFFDDYWGIYTEAEVRQALSRMTEYWILNNPERRREYIEILNKYDIKLWHTVR